MTGYERQVRLLQEARYDLCDRADGIGYRCNAWRRETLEDFIRCGGLGKVKVAHLYKGSILNC